MSPGVKKGYSFRECSDSDPTGGEIYFSDVLSSKRPNTDGIIKKGDNNMYETIYKEVIQFLWFVLIVVGF